MALPFRLGIGHSFADRVVFSRDFPVFLDNKNKKSDSRRSGVTLRLTQNSVRWAVSGLHYSARRGPATLAPRRHPAVLYWELSCFGGSKLLQRSWASGARVNWESLCRRALETLLHTPTSLFSCVVVSYHGSTMADLFRFGNFNTFKFLNAFFPNSSFYVS